MPPFVLPVLSKAGTSLGIFAAPHSYRAELHGQYQVFSSMPRGQNSARSRLKHDLEENRLSPSVLLLSDDEVLANFVLGIVKRPWKLVRHGADKYGSREVFAQPNVQLVILDDQAVVESERGWLLTQIRKHFQALHCCTWPPSKAMATRNGRARQCPLLRFETALARAIRLRAAIISAGTPNLKKQH